MKLTLNVGCGERVYGFYPREYKCINYDERKIPGMVNVVGDATKLSFPDNCFDYILASDIIEHFPIAKTQEVLQEWVRVLKVGGTIEFRLPNIEHICSDYLKRKGEDRQNGAPISQYFSWLLYGGQDYPGNFHYVGFDRRSIVYECKKVGLEEINWIKEGYNMVVKFRRV
jgi:predicted SAM-dependent methyltransferase